MLKYDGFLGGGLTDVAPMNHVLDGGTGKEQFWVVVDLLGPLKSIASHYILRCTQLQQKINNGISATAAANCVAPDWLVSH